MSPRLRAFCIILGCAAAYGLAGRLLFAFGPLQDWLQIVSAAFIYSLPFSLGALVCFLGWKLDRPSRFWSLVAPPVTMLVLLAGSVLVALEAMFCALVAAPVVMLFALLGGWLMGVLLRRRDRSRLQMAAWLLLPYGVSPLEQAWRQPDEQRVIRDAVTIRASAEEIWQQIREVPAIRPEELRWRWIYGLGFPRPLAATLDREGVGGRRLATFERNVSFYEEVTVWQPPQRLAFTIRADPAFIPRTAFDEHIIVGGRFYDVLDGAYTIEALGSDCCLLRLASTHRLSTVFNRYAGWWSEWVMHQIQGSILEVIRARCERG